MLFGDAQQLLLCGFTDAGADIGTGLSGIVPGGNGALRAVPIIKGWAAKIPWLDLAKGAQFAIHAHRIDGAEIMWSI